MGNTCMANCVDLHRSTIRLRHALLQSHLQDHHYFGVAEHRSVSGGGSVGAIADQRFGALKQRASVVEQLAGKCAHLLEPNDRPDLRNK